MSYPPSLTELIAENHVYNIGVVAPVRPASPLPPNVPTGPRNQNKYRDRDGNAPAVDGLDYGGGGGGGSGGVGNANERERDIRDRDRERSERDSHRDRDRGDRDRDSHRDRDRDRDRSERDRDRSDRSERDRERERDRSVKEDGRSRRTPSAELEDRSSSRYVILIQLGVLRMFECILVGNGGVRRDWKTRVHQNGANVLTTIKADSSKGLLKVYLLTYFLSPPLLL